MHKMIVDAGTVAIASHCRPDGDSLGSAVALRLALLGMGKKTVDIFIDDVIPKKMSYLADIQKVESPLDIRADMKYNLLIILDTSSEDRIGKSTELRGIAEKVLCIDHHMNNRIEADERVVDEGSAATGEILFSYFTQNKITITEKMAEALYTSLATDTGCFMHPNTTSSTHAATSELMKIGANTAHVNYVNFKVYDRRSINGVAYVMSNIRFFCDGKIATVYIPFKIMRKYNLKDDTDRLKNVVCEASGVRVGAFISEEVRGILHVSLRSHGEVDVAAVAGKFNGGGHKNASGFVFKGKHKDLRKQIIARLKEVV